MTRPLPTWAVLALVAAAYVGVVNAGFVWDDTQLVTLNRAVQAPSFTDVWLRNLWCCTVPPLETSYYRPLMTVSLLVDHALFAENAAGFHVTSLLWHLLVTWLVAALLAPRVGPARASVAALLFGLHPVQSEAVAWIAARNDVMSAAGVLGALLALDRKRPALAAVTALAACLSKENAFLLPAVLWVWRRAWGDRVGAREWLAIGLGVGAALALRSQAALGSLDTHAALTMLTPHAALQIAVTLLGWIAWPWPLIATAGLYMKEPLAAWWPAAGVALVGIVGLLGMGGRRAFWLLALGAGVLAPSAWGVLTYGTIGARYLYLPLFGVVAAAVATVPDVRGARIGLGAAVLASLAALHLRLPVWVSDQALFEDAATQTQDAFTLTMLGLEYVKRDRVPEGMVLLDRAIATKPTHQHTCVQTIGVASTVLSDADLLDRGRVWSDVACKGTPGFDGTLALALATRGLWSDAERVALAAARNDVPLRRDELVRAALDARDGDLASLGARALSWPGGVVELQDKVALLLLARRAPATDVTGADVTGAAAP